MASPVEHMATEIAIKSVEVLEGRSGFDHFWDDIDDDIKEEILDEIRASVESILKREGYGT